MFSRLLILFVLVPAVELYLLILLGTRIGAIETFGVIVATGLLGSFLAKTQGLATWIKLQKKLTTGQLPGKELVDGAIILVSAAFLLTPGVLTDAVGLLGLFPVTRAIFRKALLPWLMNMFTRQSAHGAIRFQATSFGPQPGSSTVDANNGYPDVSDTESFTRVEQEINPGESIIGGQPSNRPRHQS